MSIKVQMMEKMMDKFLSGMTGAEKQEMMQKMMPKMMSQMMPAMMQGGPGGNFNPCEMCERMEKALNELVKLNKEILRELKKK